jgi:hypothetical protein
VEPCWTGREKGGESGLAVLETMLGRGEIVTAEDRELRRLWGHMGTTTLDVVRRRGATPDLVMALWFAVRKLDRMRLGRGGKGGWRIDTVTRAEVMM